MNLLFYKLQKKFIKNFRKIIFDNFIWIFTIFKLFTNMDFRLDTFILGLV